MAIAPGGPGWWQATDGRWYPPQPPANAMYPYGQGGSQTPAPTNSMATTGGVIGISGAALSLIPLLGIVIGIIMGILAIIFSSIGLSRSSRMPGGKGLAVAGLVLGILTIIFKMIPGINLL